MPLSFFGGIGASSKLGILVKGSSYLEALAQVSAIAFDKTGTLTNGTFSVVEVHPAEAMERNELLRIAAHAEAYSTHPIALSVIDSYPGSIDRAIVGGVEERGGRGVCAAVGESRVLVGNAKLLADEGVDAPELNAAGTVLHVAVDGAYAGHIVIADVMKDDAPDAVRALHEAGVERTVMLTGDREEVARAVAGALGIREYRAELLPQDKVDAVEKLLEEEHARGEAKGAAGRGSRAGKVAFVGDGINDAPVLMRADVGIAMGAMGSDAAIEAADVVLMDDKPSQIARAIRIARKTLRIVYQNIVLAIGVKVIIMVLALPMIGIATMWLAVFGDVGVLVLAILNAMRCLRVKS